MEHPIYAKPKRIRRPKTATTIVHVPIQTETLRILQTISTREVRSLEEQILWCVMQVLRRGESCQQEEMKSGVS